MFPQSTFKTWRIVWLYLALVALWVVITDLIFSAVTHHFDLATLVFSTLRSGTLYLLTALLLNRILLRLKRSRQSYWDLVDSSPQPLFIHRNHKWVYVNQAGMHLVGASRMEDIVGQPVRDLIPESDWQSAEEQEFTAAGQPLFSVRERQLRRFDGTRLDVELLVTPLSIDGKLYQQILYTDVTARRQAERELRTALSHLESFIEHNTDSVAILDTSGLVTKVNPAFLKLFQVSSADVVGRQVLELPIIPAEKRSEVRDFVRSLLSGQSLVGYPTERRTAEGQLINVLLSAFPLRSPSGDISGWSVTMHDITKHKESESRLFQSEKLAAVGKLAAAIAHELKNPLTTVMGFVELIPNSTQMEQARYHDIMVDELRRISNIANEMLTLAKPQSEVQAVIDVSKLVRSVSQLLQPEAAMRSVQFSVFIEPPHHNLFLNLSEEEVAASSQAPNAVTPSEADALKENFESLLVMGLENRLKQVLINLVRNAMDALQTGQRKVTLRTASTENRVVIEIQDTGRGLSREQIERLGEPFFTTKQDGTGLGLFVCKQIVDEHHGTMEFHSTPGSGTTVNLSFPKIAGV